MREIFDNQKERMKLYQNNQLNDQKELKKLLNDQKIIMDNDNFICKFTDSDYHTNDYLWVKKDRWNPEDTERAIGWSSSKPYDIKMGCKPAYIPNFTVAWNKRKNCLILQSSSSLLNNENDDQKKNNLTLKPITKTTIIHQQPFKNKKFQLCYILAVLTGLCQSPKGLKYLNSICHIDKRSLSVLFDLQNIQIQISQPPSQLYGEKDNDRLIEYLLSALDYYYYWNTAMPALGITGRHGQAEMVLKVLGIPCVEVTRKSLLGPEELCDLPNEDENKALWAPVPFMQLLEEKAISNITNKKNRNDEERKQAKIWIQKSGGDKATPEQRLLFVLQTALQQQQGIILKTLGVIDCMKNKKKDTIANKHQVAIVALELDNSQKDPVKKAKNSHAIIVDPVDGNQTIKKKISLDTLAKKLTEGKFICAELFITLIPAIPQQQKI